MVYLPAGQSVHAVLTLTLNRPLVHETQERAPAAEAAAVLYFPPGQLTHVHVALLRYWPGGHVREQGMVFSLELLLRTAEYPLPASQLSPTGQAEQADLVRVQEKLSFVYLLRRLRSSAEMLQ